MWRDALLIAKKDLIIEMRSRVILNQVVPFALVVVIFFGIALNANSTLLRDAGGGLFWVAILFACVLAIERSSRIESQDEAGEALRLCGIDLGGMFLGKTLAVVLELIVLEIVLGVATFLVFHLVLNGLAILLISGFFATVGLASSGTIYGALTKSSNVKETLLPLLFFPIVAPVLLAASRAWQLAINGYSSQGAVWLRILIAFAVIYCVLGTILYEQILETT